MFYYKYNEYVLISNEKLTQCPFSFTDIDFFSSISEEDAAMHSGAIYFLNNSLGIMDKCEFSVSKNNDVFNNIESIAMLKSQNVDLPCWIIKKISEGMAGSINLSSIYCKNILKEYVHLDDNKKWKINVIGLGDVGGTLVTGLRLLGGGSISSIGIYDKDTKKQERWEYECNQIMSTNASSEYPEIQILKEEDIFDCDMFVFCVSLGVPPVGEEKQDVRIVQFKSNSAVAAYYAKLARNVNFKGIFAVVSDPVDFLCRKVLLESNKDINGIMDGLGLKPEQIKGFGLGVMNARACYYCKKSSDTIHYIKEGRAFGPHGEGLIIADNISNYNETLSETLTERTKHANLDIRATGFKPYIAPALSSGSLSIIDFISGKWHYSSTPISGIYFGCRNRLTPTGIQLESYYFHKNLYRKICSTYEYLKNFNVD